MTQFLPSFCIQGHRAVLQDPEHSALHSSVCWESRRAHVRMDMYSSMGSQCGRYS